MKFYQSGTTSPSYTDALNLATMTDGFQFLQLLLQQSHSPLSTRATVVKSISVRLLDLIADANGLQVLCGDIGNAFIQAMTKEKIYTRVGPEFGNRAFSMVLITRALYGKTTSKDGTSFSTASTTSEGGTSFFKPSTTSKDG